MSERSESGNFGATPAPGGKISKNARGAERVHLRFGVVGMGSVGPVLAAAWNQAGHELVGVSARCESSRERAEAILPQVSFWEPAELSRRVELLVFTVQDAELPALVERLAGEGVFRSGQLVAHTAGAYGLDVLAPSVDKGAIPMVLHPAQTFSGTSVDLKRLRGCYWTVNAPLALMPVAQALVLDIEGIPQVLSDKFRPLYHAALAHGANYLVTVVTQALRALRAAGISNPASFVEPLFTSALERALHEGEAGLSGPVSRGDAATVKKHFQALSDGESCAVEDADPALPRDDLADLPPTYRALARATVYRVFQRGLISESQFRAVLEAVEEQQTTWEQQTD